MINPTIHKYTAGFNTLGAGASIGLISYFPLHDGSDVKHTYLFDDADMQMLLYFGAMFLALGNLANTYMIHRENKNTNQNTVIGTNTSNPSVKHLNGAGIAMSVTGIALLSCAVLYAFDVAFLNGAIFNAPRSNAGPETTSQKVIFSAIYASIGAVAAVSTCAQAKLGNTLWKGPRQ